MAQGELGRAFAALVAQGVDIYAFNPQKVSLEDLFLQVIDSEVI